MGMCQQGKVPEDGSDRCRQADTSSVFPPLRCHVSTAVQMFAKESILGAKSWTWAKTAASSRSLKVTSPVGLVSVTSRAWVTSEKGDHQTNHWPSGFWQTPPIPVLEASIAPYHASLTMSGERGPDRRGVLGGLQVQE